MRAAVNIICMKWGDKFSADYVNILWAMVRRNITLDFQLVCCTDDPAGIRPEVVIQPLPQLQLPSDAPERGWRKLSVFAQGFSGLQGAALFLDLDVVIVGNIDGFFTQKGDFLIAPDSNSRGRVQGNSSVFRFEVGKYPQILSHFEKNFAKISQQVRHEQAYLSQQMHRLGKLDFWDDSWVPSFKYRCCPSWLKSWQQAPSIPKGAKIIIFHGLPNPPEAILGISGKWYRHIQPSPWISEHWRQWFG